MSTHETPLKLEDETIIERVLGPLRELAALVPENHRGNTHTMATMILQNLERGRVATHVAAPVLTVALEKILTAVLERSHELRSAGHRHPSDPKEHDA